PHLLLHPFPTRRSSDLVEFKTPVAIFSLEMSSIQLVNRMISAEAELEGEKIKRGQLADHEWTQLVHKTNKLATAPIFIDDTPALDRKSTRLNSSHVKIS